jgi:hypothetical protein
MGGRYLELSEHEATIAVIAHQLMTTIALIAGSAATLRGSWHMLTESERSALLDRIEGHAALASSELRDTVLGVLSTTHHLV